MLSPICCQLPVFRIKSFGASVKSVHFDLARLENRMALLPYPHRHDFYHIVWVTRGSGSHIIDSEQYEVRANTLFFMAPGQVHDFRLSDDTTGFTINFSAEFYALQLKNKNMLNEIPIYDLEHPVSAIYFGADEAADLRKVMDGMTEEYDKEHTGYQDVLRSYLSIFLTKASRMAVPPSSNEISLRSVSLTRRFKGLLEQHFHTVGDVAGYARMLGVTERVLNEATRHTAGITANRMLRERVMLEAKRLLLHSPVHVAEIASQLAFDDPAYFSRCFKKHTGRSPVDYRRALVKLQA
jgi:AraC family transcriptional activator of pobA